MEHILGRLLKRYFSKSSNYLTTLKQLRVLPRVYPAQLFPTKDLKAISSFIQIHQCPPIISRDFFLVSILLDYFHPRTSKPLHHPCESTSVHQLFGENNRNKVRDVTDPSTLTFRRTLSPRNKFTSSQDPY